MICMEKMVLIDGNSLLNRAYYATPLFTTKNGLPTNAIFGFIKLLFKILDDVKPEYLLVAFDMKAPTFRHKMYDGYKATRKPMPDDLAAQVDPLKELLKAMKIATYGKEGIEADDILGTLSKKFDVKSIIYTGDRDSYQLVDGRTEVSYTKRGVSDVLHLTTENFKGEVGLEPSQIIDLKALMGDKSDNIPGIPGIGEKTAVGLLAKYGTLDGIYANLDELKEATREKFENNRDIAYLSYKLATIDRDCEVDIELSDCKTPAKFGGEVRKMFSELEFRSLLNLDIFEDGGQGAETDMIAYPERVLCSSSADFSAAGKRRFAAVFFGDYSCEIYDGERQYAVKIQENLQDVSVDYDDYIKILAEVFSDSGNEVVCFDFKDVLHRLARLGVEVKCGFEDLAIAKYLCDNGTSSFDLKEMCSYYLYDYTYCAFAVDKLFLKYRGDLGNDGMTKLYEEIEKPLVRVLFNMERAGVLVSKERLYELSAKYLSLAEEYGNSIYAACGKKFNLNSPAQLAEILYDKFGLTEVKKQKTGKFSTSAEVLEKLVDKAPVVGDVLKYRLYQKLRSTYCEGLLPLIDKKSGLIHTTFHQTLTSTGRLSSSDPNLQNIPIREEEGRELRKIFVPAAGNVFIDADYSQIELRLLAHFSGCKELIEAYNEGKDIHSATAAQVFGVDEKDVTPKMRREAKAVNFGIIYGISEYGLSKNLNIPVVTAREYIKKYFETYTAVREYMDSNVEFARKNGYVATLTGRKRVIPEIKATNYALRQFGERAAMNMPLQGSSADIIKIAMINVAEEFEKLGLKSKLILQVHDELLVEAPEEEIGAASEILRREMENAVSLRVPLTVDLHTGRDWYEAK